MPLLPQQQHQHQQQQHEPMLITSNIITNMLDALHSGARKHQRGVNKLNACAVTKLFIKINNVFIAVNG